MDQEYKYVYLRGADNKIKINVFSQPDLQARSPVIHKLVITMFEFFHKLEYTSVKITFLCKLLYTILKIANNDNLSSFPPVYQTLGSSLTG